MCIAPYNIYNTLVTAGAICVHSRSRVFFSSSSFACCCSQDRIMIRRLGEKKWRRNRPAAKCNIYIYNIIFLVCFGHRFQLASVCVCNPSLAVQRVHHIHTLYYTIQPFHIIIQPFFALRDKHYILLFFSFLQDEKICFFFFVTPSSSSQLACHGIDVTWIVNVFIYIRLVERILC